MVIHNFHFQRIFTAPAEADAPLVIDADAVLAYPVALQGFQPIPRRREQIVQAPRLVQQQQFSPCYTLNLRRQPPRYFVVKKPLGFRADETAYHLRYAITLSVMECKIRFVQSRRMLRLLISFISNLDEIFPVHIYRKIGLTPKAPPFHSSAWRRLIPLDRIRAEEQRDVLLAIAVALVCLFSLSSKIKRRTQNKNTQNQTDTNVECLDVTPSAFHRAVSFQERQ